MNISRENHRTASSVTTRTSASGTPAMFDDLACIEPSASLDVFANPDQPEVLEALDALDALADARETARGSSDLAMALATSPLSSSEALLSLARIMDDCAEALSNARDAVERALARTFSRHVETGHARRGFSYELVGLPA